MGEKNDTKPTDFLKGYRRNPAMGINQNIHCIRTIKTEKSFEEDRGLHMHVKWNIKQKKTWYW